MSHEQVLYDGQAATSAVKVLFELTLQDFQGSTPQLWIGGTLVAGDDVFLWTWVNGAWVANGTILDETVWRYSLPSIGKYGITITLNAVGPVSVSLMSANPDKP
jgi:hypothetical protein